MIHLRKCLASAASASRVLTTPYPGLSMNAHRKRRRIADIVLRALILVLTSICTDVGLAWAQTTGPTAEEKLEREFTDPLTDFPQLLVRDNYTPATYGTNVQTNQVIVRPIVPRLPAYTLLPFPQIV